MGGMLGGDEYGGIFLFSALSIAIDAIPTEGQD